MPLVVTRAKTERLVETLSKLTGQTKTEVVRRALKDRLDRLQRGRGHRRLADHLDEIALRCVRLPPLDARSPDEILGYDDRGLPR